MTDPGFSSTPYSPDRLIAGDYPTHSEEVTLTDNQGTGALARGTVVASADGVTFGIVHQTGTMVAGEVRGILAKDADPSGGDVTALVYFSGSFNEDEIVLGGTVSIADVRDNLRVLNVFLKSPVSA